MTTALNALGPPRRMDTFAENTLAGVDAAVSKASASAPAGMDDETAKTVGGRLLAAGGVLLAGSVALLEIGARAAGIETGLTSVGGAGLMTLMAGMGAATIGAALRFPTLFASWLPDKHARAAG